MVKGHQPTPGCADPPTSVRFSTCSVGDLTESVFDYQPRRECSAEPSEDDWTIEIPPLGPEDQELVAAFDDGSG
jgi:hypothetical protein